MAETAKRHADARVRLRIPPAHRLFLVLAPFIYACFALLTPPFETPDEHQHLFRAWQLSEFHLFGERRGDEAGGALPPAVGRAAARELGSTAPHVIGYRKVVQRKPDRALANMTRLAPEEQPRFFNFPGAVIYSPAGYLPQVAAIWLGRLLGLPVEAILLLGRLLNATLAIALFYAALRLTPVGVLAIFWLGLFPMTAAMAASFGQDGLVIGGAALLTATGLRLLRDGRWNPAELWLTAVLAMLVTLSKLLYLPLALIGALPALKKDQAWRQLAVPLVICLASAFLALLWTKSIGGLIVNVQPGVPPVGERLAAWLAHPAQPIILLLRTYVERGHDLADTLFTFGWLNIGPVRVAGLVSVIALGVLLYAGDRSACLLDWRGRLWLMLLAGASMGLISLALYFYWTPADSPWIQGLQGRYFLPLAPAVLLAVLPARARLGNMAIALVALLMVAANLASLIAIVRAFYN